MGIFMDVMAEALTGGLAETSLDEDQADEVLPSSSDEPEPEPTTNAGTPTTSTATSTTNTDVYVPPKTFSIKNFVKSNATYIGFGMVLLGGAYYYFVERKKNMEE